MDNIFRSVFASARVWATTDVVRCLREIETKDTTNQMRRSPLPISKCVSREDTHQLPDTTERQLDPTGCVLC